MDTKARYPFKWFGLLTPLSVALAMTLSTGTLRASPIDDERQPEPTDPSAYYDEPEDRAGALNAILTMPDANEDAFDLPDGVKGSRDTERVENVLQLRARGEITLPSNLALEKRTNPFLRTSETSVKQKADERNGRDNRSGAEVFASLRAWKDKF